MTLILVALVLLLTGAVLSLIFGKRHPHVFIAVTVLIVCASILTGYIALSVLIGQEILTHSSPWGVPGGAFILHLDALSAFFLLPVAILPPLAAIYSLSYLKEESKTRHLGYYWAIYSTFVAGLILVVTAASVLLFLAGWEIMTLGSFLLVSYDHQHREVRQASWLYLLVAHIGLLFLLAFFLLASTHCGGLDFSTFATLKGISPAFAASLFFLALCGFGIKAGLFPFFVWLPDAHPAAPSHISAVMSGVVVKIGIYGILRVITFLPPISAPLGGILLILGLFGALYGISMAMLQKDIKRSLAYSTVENIGVIFMALGLGLLASAKQLPVVAFFAFAGALLHIWNHTLFKGLLFLAAGTLLHATGTRNLDQMGGLLRRMPQAGLLTIGGSIALTALPPLNGFVGEWFIYLGLFHAGTAMIGVSALLITMVLAILAVVGALTIITFTRLIGIALLGDARTPAAAQAQDADLVMLWPIRLLFVLCLLMGLFPQMPMALLMPLLSQLALVSGAELASISSDLNQISRWGGGICLALFLVTFISVYLWRKRPSATAPTWGCAFPRPTSQMSYTAEGYSEFACNHLLPEMMRPEGSQKPLQTLFPDKRTFFLNFREIVLQRFYQPIFTDLANICVRLRWLQQGKQHLYLLYIFSCCAILILWSILGGS